jgi:hypothetical protein
MLLVIEDSLEDLLVSPPQELAERLREEVVVLEVCKYFAIQEHVVIEMGRKTAVEVLDMIDNHPQLLFAFEVVINMFQKVVEDRLLGR